MTLSASRLEILGGSSAVYAAVEMSSADSRCDPLTEGRPGGSGGRLGPSGPKRSKGSSSSSGGPPPPVFGFRYEGPI